MQLRRGNLFVDADPPPTGERFEDVRRHGRLQIERIVSSGQPDTSDDRQTQDEWVVLLAGQATLVVAGERVDLVAGDHLWLPAGTEHRVERTSDGAPWLAVHLHPEIAPVD